MYQFAYSEICEELPSQNVPTTRRLSDAIELIEAVQDAPSFHEWLGVLSDFRKLWLLIIEDLPLCSREAAEDQSQFSGIADSVLQEIERCRFYKPEMFTGAWRGMWPQ